MKTTARSKVLKKAGVKTIGQKEKESKKSGYYGAKNFDEHYVPKRYR
jgi:hypothetical protein